MTEQNFGGTLGALFLGNLCAAVLFGMSCVQGYTYYKTAHKDSPAFRFLIFFLWCLESFHLALITQASYYYMVSNFNNVLATKSSTWPLLAQIYVTPAIGTLIRAVFGRRVWLIHGRNHYLAGCIGVFSVAALISTYIFTSKAFHVVAFKDFGKLSHTLYPAFVFSFVADIFIAAPLCLELFRRRTGHKRSGSDSVIKTVIRHSVNTCILTTTCMGMVFITFVVWPDKLIFIGIHYSFSKLYFNSLLAALNNREALAEQLEGVFFLGSTTQEADDTVIQSRGLSQIKFQSVIKAVNQEMDISLDARSNLDNEKRDPVSPPSVRSK